ncbi:hypothetical protein OTU49_007985 [Cherax quadricarinatus]|uniref:RNA helicase n=1 Tax=Cherax quadricarinatus TaxID=27406 RepID=A0AAW0WTU0_CHEQU|nr:ATP-dependent RNA helicase A protein-like [Cherax quadricarinatus]
MADRNISWVEKAVNFKEWLHTYCMKKKLHSEFVVTAKGPKYRNPLFFCEARVSGYDFVAHGKSKSSKVAQNDAAKELSLYLINNGEVPSYEVPTLLMKALRESEKKKEEEVSSSGGNVDTTNMECTQERKATEEAEEEDPTAVIHGNWTLANARSGLSRFLRANDLKADFKYREVGPEHLRSYVAEMSFYVKQIQREIRGEKHGPNKRAASRNCCLSIVQQLYELNLLEPFSKKLIDFHLRPYQVALSPELTAMMDSVIQITGIQPVQPNNDPSQPNNLVTDVKLPEFEASEVPQYTGGVVSWSPPQKNWNAWTSCTLDEGPFFSLSLDEISADLQEAQKDCSESVTEQRAQLPVYKVKPDIISAISENPVTIIRGNTDSGKTTQVCQFILDNYIQSGSGGCCNIIVTQPHSISAVSVAERIASERGEEIGNSVGYSVELESVLPRPYGGMWFCTVGVLLRKLEAGLRGVSHVIVDEIHERDINTDFLLIVLHDMVRAFPDLRIILLSASIDISLFLEYFANPHVIEVPGQAFPVRQYFLEDCIELIKFTPTTDSDSDWNRVDKDEELPGEEPEENLNIVNSSHYSDSTRKSLSVMNEKELNFELVEALLKYIYTLSTPGAVLIFLPGWDVIFNLMRHLEQDPVFGTPQYCVLPLHSQLPREDQRRVFDPVPDGVRKIILATNIAESSVSISDVAFVIDSCKSKVKLFTSHNHVTNYATLWASRTNLEQRKCRAGTVRAGICFHLCTKARYEKLDEHTTPEMVRTPLHEISLLIKLLRLGSIGEFLSRAIHAPPTDAITEARATLREMKCLGSNEELTPLGRILARLPIDPHLAKMVILGCIFFCGDAMCTLAALNTTTEIFIMSPESRRLSQFQRDFAGNRYSDHIATLSVFNSWLEAKAEGEEAEIRFCEDNRISLPALRVTWEAKNQLKELLVNATGFPEECLLPQTFNFYGSADPKLDIIVGLVALGHYPNVCAHKFKFKVLTQDSKVALIHKSSVNNSKQILKFPSPYFIFEEKICSQTVSCKRMTMVTPIHLILFGCRRVEAKEGLVRLDGWLEIDFQAEHAAKILTLRPSLESLVARSVVNPESITKPTYKDEQVMNCILQLCCMNAGRYKLEKIVIGDVSTPSPPMKRMRTDDGPDDSGDETGVLSEGHSNNSGLASGDVEMVKEENLAQTN